MAKKHKIPTAEVIRQTGLSSVTLWRKSKSGDFPQPVYVGSRKFWYQNDVDLWNKQNERTTPAFNNLKAKSN